MSWQDPERFEVVAVRHVTDPRKALGYVTAADNDDTLLDIVVTHYETYLDARLGAQGMRPLGFRIAGIQDRESEEMLPATPVREGEVS